MADKKEQVKDFISYVDDDGTVKNQYVIIIKETPSAIEFKFELTDPQTIVVPWHKINKLKRKK